MPPKAPWPLPLRLPNPPSPVVGRVAQGKRLAALIEQGPVAVVAGPGGIGKTTLALRVLHERFGERVGRTVFVALREGEAGEAPALVALRALVRACGVEGVDWPELLHQAEAQAAMALDLAERNGLWVLLDDLHRAPAAEASELLRRLRRYARQSRWLVTTREAPHDPELASHTLALGALSTKELVQLGRLLDPGAPARVHAERAAQAAGSPWALRRLASTRLPGVARGPGLGDLDASQRAWLGALRRAQVPVPPAVLGALWPPGSWRALLDRGVLEETALGFRIHETASDALERDPPPADREREAARALGAALLDADDDGLAAAGAQLLLRGGAAGEARAAIERRADRLLAAGYAPALWSSLPATDDLAHLRLRCAVELGDPQALASIALPAQAPAGLRLLTARALLLRGEPLAAADAAREVLGAETEPRARFEAGFVEAQGLANGGELLRAEALLDALRPVDAGQGAQRDGLLANVLGLVGKPEAALARARAAAPVVASLAWPLRSHVALSLARSLYSTGRIDEGRAVLDEAIEHGNPTSTRLDTGRRLRFLRACIAVDGGDLARGRDELERLEPYLGRASLLSPHVEAAWAHLHLAEGDLDAFEPWRARLASREPRGQLADELGMLELRARLLRGDGLPPGPAPSPEGSIFAGMASILWSQLALRSGHLDAAGARLDPGLAPRHIELRFESQLHEALRLMLLGDARGALDLLARLAAECEATGWTLRLADAIQRSAEAALLLGDAPELHRLSARLAAVASASWAHRPVAAFFAALGGPVDWAQLERLAQQGPVAARCRALLGGPAPLDRIDRRIVEALAPRFGLARPLRPSAPWQPGWGLDPARRAAWRPDGSWVALGDHPTLWALLAALAASGGEATKEHLTLTVWGERSYHPLRHDNRLQAAVRKLRVRLEDDPTHPRRLLTTADGYALGAPVRLAPGPDPVLG